MGILGITALNKLLYRLLLYKHWNTSLDVFYRKIATDFLVFCQKRKGKEQKTKKSLNVLSTKGPSAAKRDTQYPFSWMEKPQTRNLPQNQPQEVERWSPS